MADKTTIVRIVITKKNGKIDKLISSDPPHQKRKGEFIWQIENGLVEDVKVDLVPITNEDFIEIVSQLPTTAPAGGVALAQANVVKAKKGAETTVKYNVMIDNLTIDPDLIIDGDPGPFPPILKKGGAKKKGVKKR